MSASFAGKHEFSEKIVKKKPSMPDSWMALVKQLSAQLLIFASFRSWGINWTRFYKKMLELECMWQFLTYKRLIIRRRVKLRWKFLYRIESGVFCFVHIEFLGDGNIPKLGKLHPLASNTIKTSFLAADPLTLNSDRWNLIVFRLPRIFLRAPSATRWPATTTPSRSRWSWTPSKPP